MTESQPRPSSTAETVAARVRRNAVNSLIPAVLLTIVFWRVIGLPLDTASTGEKVLAASIWCLRLAGPILFLVAVVCWTGRLLGFLMDAIVSSVIALALTAMAIVLLPGLVHGSVESLVLAVFAVLYVRTGWSLWGAYLELRGAARMAAASTVPAETGCETAISGQVIQERQAEECPRSYRQDGNPRAESPGLAAAPAVEPIVSDEPPPDGFLAGFADRRPGEDEKR